MPRFAIVDERSRIVILESEKQEHPNGRRYIIRKNGSPYRAGFRYCSRCALYILTRRKFCPEHRETVLRTKPL